MWCALNILLFCALVAATQIDTVQIQFNGGIEAVPLVLVGESATLTLALRDSTNDMPYIPQSVIDFYDFATFATCVLEQPTEPSESLCPIGRRNRSFYVDQANYYQMPIVQAVLASTNVSPIGSIIDDNHNAATKYINKLIDDHYALIIKKMTAARRANYQYYTLNLLQMLPNTNYTNTPDQTYVNITGPAELSHLNCTQTNINTFIMYLNTLSYVLTIKLSHLGFTKFMTTASIDYKIIYSIPITCAGTKNFNIYMRFQTWIESAQPWATGQPFAFGYQG